MTCAGAMMISFSTVRLARITSAMLEVWAIVVREPVARVSDCAGASDALSSTSPRGIGGVDAEQDVDLAGGRRAGAERQRRRRAQRERHGPTWTRTSWQCS